MKSLKIPGNLEIVENLRKPKRILGNYKKFYKTNREIQKILGNSRKSQEIQKKIIENFRTPIEKSRKS